VRDRLCAVDRCLSEAITAVEEEVRQVVRPREEEEYPLAGDDGQDVAQWVVTSERLHTIPGVGRITAWWIVVSTRTFTIGTNAEQAAAYAGLAPMPRQSGTRVQKRPWSGQSGNARLRRALYLATLSGARFNPPLQTFYDRLIDNGKPKKVARCAVARKLLHIAWAVGKKGQDFNPLHGPAAA
jgi:transposase